jgi:peptidoglycan/LPS O-acetylase OafA/YrhL
VFQPAATLLARSALHPLMRWLAGISYPVFLLHYGVCMVCGAVVSRLWPEEAWPNLLGMAAAWGLSLLAGWLLAQHLPGAVKPLGRVAATASR